MKKAKNSANRVFAQAKKQYWSSFCANEVYNHKDMQKVWDKLKHMKNGINLPNCPISLDNMELPSNKEKAEAFAEMFSKYSRTSGLSESCKKYRENQENTDMLQVPQFENNNIINAPITIHEVKDCISTISKKRTSVGIDGISNEMLCHLPHNMTDFLHRFFQKCWNEGAIPDIWKRSIVVPIHKKGKPKTDKNSYRPIALTSHTCKLMEKIILNRLNHHCERYKVIPVNQAGFRKGRSTIDHLVKLTTQVKQQFARRKNILATFFDIKKAYDQVWHHRLLTKIKNIGISGNMYNYLMSFLSNRSIVVRVGGSYSNAKQLQMGLPQGSVIAPILFNILIADLPKDLSKESVLAQFADDICLWMKVTMKRKTPTRTINHTKKIYQCELDKINNFMLENGLTLSLEKTNIMLFNSGSDPEKLPSFMIDGTQLKYVQSVKFLGVFLTSKLSWNSHIDYILNKARKSINFLKIISKQCWGQDTKTLISLATSLVRSRIIYAQEVYFSAPQYLLKKLQNVDCKAYKLAIGVPAHASPLGTYREACVSSLDEQRILSTAKFILKSSTYETFSKREVNLKIETDFAKRAKSIHSLQPIYTFTSDLLNKTNLHEKRIEIKPTFTPIPDWIQNRPDFDLDHTDLAKCNTPYLLKHSVTSYLRKTYENHLKIYTDGSVLDDGNAGAAFYIPALKTEKLYHIGKLYSIFTAELIAIQMALRFISRSSSLFDKDVIFCVDSKSALEAIR